MVKKVTPAASTPTQPSYPQPYQPPGPWSAPLMQTPGGVEYARGAMANTPTPGWGYSAEALATTPPSANPAAVRAYTRNAPYMEQFMSDPQTMVAEMRSLARILQDSPDDVVSAYRLRVLQQALSDVFGMQAPNFADYGSRAQAPATPLDIGVNPVTPRRR